MNSKNVKKLNILKNIKKTNLTELRQNNGNKNNLFSTSIIAHHITTFSCFMAKISECVKIDRIIRIRMSRMTAEMF